MPTSFMSGGSCAPIENSPPGIQTISGGFSPGAGAVLGLVGPKDCLCGFADLLDAGMSVMEAGPEPSEGRNDSAFDSIGSWLLKIAMPAAPARTISRLIVHRVARRDRNFLRCLTAAVCFAIASLA